MPVPEAYPLGRILLRFEREADDPDLFRRELSGCARDSDGNLWLGTDELTGLSRLREKAAGTFTKHDYTDLAERLDLPEEDEEIDIEGLDIAGDRLWIVGSHTSTRKRVKSGKDPVENLARLARVRMRPNRFLIACAAIDDGKLKNDAIAQLPITDAGNALTLALRQDPHLGPFMCASDEEGGCTQITAKENGFDIEGAAVRGRRLFLGLRGPVLRGWAILLEIHLTETDDGYLALEPIGTGGRFYRKHFLALGGMGVRDLLWQGTDLLILAGPTMDITGLQSVYRFRYAADLADDSISPCDGMRLAPLFHLPFVGEGDKAEGLCRFDGLGDAGLLVVYDAPRSDRLVAGDGVLADVFVMPDA